MTRHAMRLLSCLLGIALALPLRAAPATIGSTAEAILERHATAPILVVGEMHGTLEAPALVAELADRLSGESALTVGLEIIAQEQSRLDAYLASDGSAAARDALLAGEFWQRPHERSDGRRSVAMLQLIEQLRVLHSSGRKLGVLAFDDTGFYRAQQSRDALMARVLRAAHQAKPSVKLLVLTGNYHARLDQPRQVRSGDQMIQPPMPMTGMLQDLGVASVYLAARGGEYWGCSTPATPCGIQALPKRSDPLGDEQAIDVRALPSGGSFHLQVELPRFHASPPLAVSTSTETDEDSGRP